MSKSPEGKIVRAAIRVDEDDVKIFTGYRHSHIMSELKEKFGYDAAHMMILKSEQGFVTENGIFLTRSEALSYSDRIGQIMHQPKSHILTSEDLWDNEGNPV